MTTNYNTYKHTKLKYVQHNTAQSNHNKSATKLNHASKNK